MKKIIDIISEAVSDAFSLCGYDPALGKCSRSNRPDLCEFQCNGSLSGAKIYKKAPLEIANDVAAKLSQNPYFSKAEAVKPGFINIDISDEFLSDYLEQMKNDEKFGCSTESVPKTVVIDYGGPNVAKPLHVGHLRSAIIGDCLKRLNRFFGNIVIGDVHLGDWGLQMGLIIEEVKERQPNLCYFDDNFVEEYPDEAPFTIEELEEIYPTASAKAKVDDDFARRAHNATFKLQNNDRGYRALWQHILNVSVSDLKKNYGNLDVSFDVWKKESDAHPYIPVMLDDMKKKGLAYESQGALVMDVKEDSDTKEVPPCILMKSDGAVLYTTTDLATLVEREKLFHPDRVLYVVDKRQEMHFTQVFRAARKSGIVRDETRLSFLGFGTMNGKDGKPFKTREGGVMRLEKLIADITSAVYDKSLESNHIEDDENRQDICHMISLAALKYGDLSNQASKDYVFDLDKFSSFDGNTGPYILYNIVRIKTIIDKFTRSGHLLDERAAIRPSTKCARTLCLVLSKFNEAMEQAYTEDAPHRICGYVYELAASFNDFYNETKILSETDEVKQSNYILLISMVRDVLVCAIGLLGIKAPDRM